MRRYIVAKITSLTASYDLTRAASMAIVLLHRARSSPDHDPEARKLLAKSDEYFQEAVLGLGSAGIPLEAQLLACLDLEAYQVSRCVARAPCACCVA